MSDLKPELSKRNKWHISKHKYLELKHYCLQYPEWKKSYAELLVVRSHANLHQHIQTSKLQDTTSHIAIMLTDYKNRMEMIERTANLADPVIGAFILKAVTEEYSFNYLKMQMDMPCERDMYYDRYRKFFWLLSKER